jgi:gluconate transporter
MPIVTIAVGVVLLLVLILWLRLNAFIALLLAAFAVGLLNGMEAAAVLASILEGVGNTMGKVALILVFGAMLGKLIEDSGAASAISLRLTDILGVKRIQFAVLITAFLVGLPMIYNASFLVLIPLVYAFSTTNRLPLMYLGIPLSAALSVTHGYLPPHPAPTSVALSFKADVNLTLLYGLVLAVPVSVICGPLFARLFRNLDVKPPPALFTGREFRREELPGLGVSLFVTLLPIVLMAAGKVVAAAVGGEGAIVGAAKFLSDPNVALFLAVVAALAIPGIRRGRSMDDLMKSLTGAAGSVAMIILIIAAGGAFGEVINDSGTGSYIQELARQAQLPPLVLAWTTAAFLRVALGSATVAAITAAGVVLPIVPTCGVKPELMVLATATGSLVFSHLNDIGFWMFKEYYNLDIKKTFLIWTTMETLIAVLGLGGVLLLNAVL